MLDFFVNRIGVSIELDAWYLSVYFNPRVWAFGFHRNASCCKWWLLLGPFEVNRVWTDEDEYPFASEEN